MHARLPVHRPCPVHCGAEAYVKEGMGMGHARSRPDEEEVVALRQMLPEALAHGHLPRTRRLSENTSTSSRNPPPKLSPSDEASR